MKIFILFFIILFYAEKVFPEPYKIFIVCVIFSDVLNVKIIY